ncbi:hypothetical protein LCGC14_2599090, partial [marine sediment metagenome]
MSSDMKCRCRPVPILPAARTRRLLLLMLLGLLPGLCHGAGLEESRPKREPVFEFAATPKLTRDGDRWRIAFATKGFCDVTVTIENAAGRIVRHLIGGDLCHRAPSPLQKGSRSQAIIWDGKDDQGRYLDQAKDLTVRVSLGLKPRFERTLLWVPKRRASKHPPQMAAAAEGVYVYDGGSGMDELILYDHDGKYVRTVYPFPA